MAFGQTPDTAAAAGYIRRLGEQVGALQAEISKRDGRLADLERKISEIGGSKERAFYVEDIPGKRVPFWVVIQVTIPASSTSRTSGIHTLSMDGPFVATDIFASFLPSADGGANANAVNRWRGPASDEPETELAANTFSADVPDFFWELEDAGSNRARQNLPIPSAVFSHGRVNLGEFGVGDFFERQSVIRVWITPTRSMGSTGTYGVLYVTLKGYKVLVSQAFQA
jgi:hypothetical protein